MEVLYLLIPVSVLLVFGIAWAFWWSVKNGQFDDLEGPAFRILMDEDQLPDQAKPEAVGIEAGSCGAVNDKEKEKR